jgi:dimeric dUTPase (all-alpha-NTP-PPase superfamily)
MSDMLEQIMARQLQLQVESFLVNPQELEGEERDNYVMAMALALNVEVGEALQEISWKPWATGEWFNRDAFLLELIDALHFWINLVLVATDDPQDVIDVYMRKAQINVERQAAGYTGEKCPSCGR